MLLDIEANLDEIQQLRFGNRRHPEAALRLANHQAFGGQSRQRLANGAEIIAQRVAKRVDAQPLARAKPAGKQIGTQAFVSGLGEAGATWLRRHAEIIAPIGAKCTSERKSIFY
ncbi:MAG: hypothetical protein WDN49_05260 [Acetobacteraceae bacterium]